jgi:TRAP-type C4-dicarboxylate transport system substrate-binding protein
LVPWAEKIEQVTQGRVKVEIYPSATLVDKRALIEGIKNGRADLAWGVTLYWRGRFLASEVLSLPLLGFSSGESASRIYWQLYQEFPEIRSEYEGLKVLFTHYIGPYVLTTANNPIESLPDIKGLKIRAGGGVQTDMMIMFGAVPSYVGMADLYQALEKGVMDGALLPWEAISAFKFYEVVDYTLDESFSGTSGFCVMNQQKWDSLPADIKAAIETISYENAAAQMGRVYDVKEEARAAIERSGRKLVTHNLPSVDRAEWINQLRPLWDRWVADANARGIDGQKILDRALELGKEFSESYP